MNFSNYDLGFIKRCMARGFTKSVAATLLERNRLIKKSSGFLGVSSFADKVNFAANVKMLADLSNRELNKALGKDDKPARGGGIVVMAPQKKTKTKAVVSLSPEIEAKLTDEQKKKLDSIVRRINRDRNG